MADSDDEGFLLSGRAVTNTARVVRYVQGQSKSPPQAQYQRTSGSVTWHWFINDSSETAPAYAVMEVGTACTTVLSGDDIVQAIYHCTKPTTTFRRRYAINSAQPVAAGDGGWCTFEGPARIAHDTAWSPALGEAGGPKPSSWLLWKGFPGLVQHVDGIWSASDDILLGTLSPVSTLLCKATADLTVGSVSSNFQIWSGSVAAGADSGFTVLPTIEIGTPFKSGDFFVATFVDNGWVAAHPSKEITVVTAQSISGGHLYYKTRLIRVPCTDAESSNVDAGSVGGGGGGDGVARIIEGYVASPFRTQHSVFRMVITRAYDGTWPQFLGGNAASLMILNFDRLGVAPPNKGPYLFEGEASAACSAHYDPEATVTAGFPIYRARYVECPEDSPVEDESAGNYAYQLTDSYSQGGPSELVSTYYYGE